jgi:thiol-disulfide isomerase/thioredoxin
VRAELIGKEAPDFELSNFFNSEPVTLKDLRGKVVMVDFWANWCGPCKAAFPNMAELYAEYKDKGFVILGVTSLQGYFADGDVREGMQKRDLPAERELELTKDFIAKHKMTWPVAFSSRGCFDPAYGIQGIPTFAVIDKQGKVRLLQVGSGPESEAKLKALIPQLLAE